MLLPEAWLPHLKWGMIELSLLSSQRTLSTWWNINGETIKVVWKWGTVMTRNAHDICKSEDFTTLFSFFQVLLLKYELKPNSGWFLMSGDFFVNSLYLGRLQQYYHIIFMILVKDDVVS